MSVANWVEHLETVIALGFDSHISHFFFKPLLFFSAKPCIVFFFSESLRYLVRAALPAFKMHNKAIKNTLPVVTAFSSI